MTKVRIDTWQEFLRYNPSGEKITRHHVFIPYKQQELIKKHIALAVSSKEYDSGSYGPILNNCQHFVNRCILGLNISNEGTLRKKENKPLKDEILETNYHFNHLTMKNSDELSNNQKKINEYVAKVEYKSLWEWKRPVELKPTNDCKLQ